MSLKNTRVYRIRNPATLQVLYLPDAHEGANQIDIAFNSLTYECKVVCVHGEDGEGIGFEVVTVGKVERQHITRLKVLAISLLLSDGKDLYLEIQSLDNRSERVTTNTLPRGFFADLNEVSLLTWNHCLAVRNITEVNLNVLVFEDFKEHKWSQNKIIVPLKCLKDWPEWKDKIAQGIVECGILRMAIHYVYPDMGTTQTIISIDYDMSSPTVIHDFKLPPPLPCPASKWQKPSLIAPKGTKSEKPTVLRRTFCPDDGFRCLSWV